MDEVQKSKNQRDRTGSVHQVFGWLLNGLDDSKEFRVDGPIEGRDQNSSRDSAMQIEPSDDPRPTNIDSHISPLLIELQGRIDELNQKEQLVYSRLAQVDQERRKVRLWAQELERELGEREQRVLGLEEQLSGIGNHAQKSLENGEKIPLIDERTGRGDQAPSIQQLIQQPVVEQLAVLLVLADHLVQENTRLDALASGKVEAVELTQLEQKQNEFREECDVRQRELDQQERTLEKRTRFQQSHLDKLRRQIEDAQDRFRLELQQARTWIENDRTKNRYVANQLKKFRSLLDDREESLERERLAIQEMHVTNQDEFTLQKAVREEQHELANIERQNQHDELTRREDTLNLKSSELDTRQEVVQHLEQQVQQMYASSLEMRATIEKAWSDLVEHAGEESAKSLIRDAQDSVADEASLLTQIVEERREFGNEAIERIQSQQDQFLQIVAEQEQSSVERNENLRLQANRLETLLESIQVRQSESTADRLKWAEQKLQAEGIIRDLLSRLEEQSNH